MINTEDKNLIYKFLIKCNNFINLPGCQYYNPNIIALIHKALSSLKVSTLNDTEINPLITLIHEKFEKEGYKVKNIFENLPSCDVDEIDRYSNLFGSEIEIREGNVMDIWKDMNKLCWEISNIDGKK